MESQVIPLNDSIKTLEKEVAHLKSMIVVLGDKETSSKQKMREALDELQEKSEMFIGAGDSLAKKDDQIEYIQGKLDKNTELMYKYELERNNLEKRL